AIVECITQAAEATGLRSAVAPGNPCVCFFENEVEALCDVLGRTCTARDSVEDDDRSLILRAGQCRVDVVPGDFQTLRSSVEEGVHQRKKRRLGGVDQTAHDDLS